MDDKLKATITQRLEELPDETARQLLDYIEFLESKYNRSTRDRSPFERLADNVEGTLRATRIGEAAIKGTSSVFDAASSVVKGVADAGRVVVEELQKIDLSEVSEEEKRAESGEETPGESERPVAEGAAEAEAKGEQHPSEAAEADSAQSATDDVEDTDVEDTKKT